jgi:hypothetical protein
MAKESSDTTLAGYQEDEEIEESQGCYRVGGFHSVRLGEVYKMYSVIRKLGYGTYSTVWLVRGKE